MDVDLVDSTLMLTSTSIIMREIGFFIMTREIDLPYNSISDYRTSVNNPFCRALWHLAYYIDFQQITESESESKHVDPIYAKFFNMLDTFCLLSRVKTFDEFSSSFRRTYRNITNATMKEHDIEIPVWMYQKYSSMSIPPIYTNSSNLSILPLMHKIGPSEYYQFLCKAMIDVPRCVSIRDVVCDKLVSNLDINVNDIGNENENENENEDEDEDEIETDIDNKRSIPASPPADTSSNNKPKYKKAMKQRYQIKSYNTDKDRATTSTCWRKH